MIIIENSTVSAWKSALETDQWPTFGLIRKTLFATGFVGRLKVLIQRAKGGRISPKVGCVCPSKEYLKWFGNDKQQGEIALLERKYET